MNNYFFISKRNTKMNQKKIEKAMNEKKGK
jgi:hypothetical protein